MLHNIKEKCKEQGITLTEMCEKANINRFRISKWDKEQPSVDKVMRVAKALNCTVEDLYYEH